MTATELERKDMDVLKRELLELEKAIHRIIEMTKMALELLEKDAGRIYRFSEDELDMEELKHALYWIGVTCKDMVMLYGWLYEDVIRLRDSFGLNIELDRAVSPKPKGEVGR